MESNPTDTYLQEVDDLLSEIEAAALSLPKDQADSEAVTRIFRAFHTIKGSGAMVGFDEVAGFTHHVETLLDQVRDGLVPLSEELSNVILAAADHIKLSLQASRGGSPVDAASQAALLERVCQLSPATGESPVLVEGSAGSVLEPTATKEWHILFRPAPSMLSQGSNPALLFRDLKKLGECVIEGHTDGLPALAELQVEECYPLVDHSTHRGSGSRCHTGCISVR